MRQAIIVLGMHRSGTSSVAGSMAHLGATPPATLLPADWDNPRGFWESRPIIALDDRMLSAGGSYWRDWRRFDAAIMAPEVGAEIRADMSRTLAHEFGDASMIVLKEPRMCRVWDQWDPVLAAEGYEAGFVLPIRSPIEVAGSLHRRNGISIAEGLLLWLRHVLDAEKVTRGRRRRILRWDRFMADWRTETDRIEQALGWRLPDRGAPASAVVDSFLSVSLKTTEASPQALSTGPDAHTWVSAAYDALTVLSETDDDPAAWAILDDIGLKFDEASVLFGRSVGALLVDMEAVEMTRDRVALDAGRTEAVARRLGRNLLLTAEHKAQIEAGLTADLAAARTEAADALASLSSVRLARDSLAERLAEMKRQMSASRADQAGVIATLQGEAAKQSIALANAAFAQATATRKAQTEQDAHLKLVQKLKTRPFSVVGSIWSRRTRSGMSSVWRGLRPRH